jgi:hypothetical protein
LNRETLTYSRGDKLSHLPAKPGLDEIVFALGENAYSEPILYDDEVVLVKLISKHISDEEEFTANRREYYRNKIEERKNSYFATFLFGKRLNYEVRINEELFHKVRDYVISKYRGS